MESQPVPPAWIPGGTPPLPSPAASSPVVPKDASATDPAHTGPEKKGKPDEKKEKPDEKKEKDDEKKEKSGDKKDDKHKLSRAEEDYYAYGVKSLFDSLTKETSGKKWFEKLNLRGYTQIRFGRTVDRNDVTPQILGDSNINGRTEDFSLRRVRLILFGDVGEHLGIYIQPDFSITPEGSVRNTFFTQLRDCYGDIYLTTDKEHRIRAGLSKVPYGFENLQSSQNRSPLDRTEALNSAVNPNERDLGLFYYWTPDEYQQLFRDLVDGGLKGSGNYGIFGIGIYNGQGGAQLEQNRNVHAVARATYPHRFENGQVVEVSIQGYRGEYVVEGSAIRPLGRAVTTANPTLIPAGTRQSTDPRGQKGLTEQRIAGTFVYYPQPIGFQCEWQVGEGPGLTPDQRRVDVRALNGGYVMAIAKLDTETCGIFYPFARYQYFRGGIRSQANAPFGRYEIMELGVEWQIWKQVELTAEYSHVNRVNTTAQTTGLSYRQFDGNLIRVQLQLNY